MTVNDVESMIMMCVYYLMKQTVLNLIILLILYSLSRHSEETIASTCFSTFLSISVFLFQCLSKWRISKFISSVVLCCCGGNTSSPVWYPYLSILPDDADIFAALQLMLDCNLPSLILSSMDVIALYTNSSRFFRKRKALSNGRVASMTKNEYASAVHFL